MKFRYFCQICEVWNDTKKDAFDHTKHHTHKKEVMNMVIGDSNNTEEDRKRYTRMFTTNEEDMMSVDPNAEDDTEVISCCGMAGVCLNSDFIPDEQEGNLKNCRREGHRELLCVPVVMTDPTWIPNSCTGQSLLGNSYEGVCLPDCLRLPFEFALDHFSCQDGYVCTPCYKLNGDPSGAPGCPESM